MQRWCEFGYGAGFRLADLLLIIGYNVCCCVMGIHN